MKTLSAAVAAEGGRMRVATVMLAAVLLLIGCDRPDLVVTAVAPPPPPSPRPERFEAPEGWQVAEAGADELLRFRIPRADGDEFDAHVVITHFPDGRGAVTVLDDGRGRFAEIDHGHDRLEEQGATLRLDIAGRYRGPDPAGGETAVDRPGHRLVAAAVATPEGLYRVTVLGPRGTLGKWEDSIESFLSTVSD